MDINYIKSERNTLLYIYCKVLRSFIIKNVGE